MHPSTYRRGLLAFSAQQIFNKSPEACTYEVLEWLALAMECAKNPPYSEHVIIQLVYLNLPEAIAHVLMDSKTLPPKRPNGVSIEIAWEFAKLYCETAVVGLSPIQIKEIRKALSWWNENYRVLAQTFVEKAYAARIQEEKPISLCH